jgi:hypothetical protein
MVALPPSAFTTAEIVGINRGVLPIARTAALLVTLPTELLTWTVNTDPLSLKLDAGVV